MIGDLKTGALGKSVRYIATFAAFCQSGPSSNPVQAAPVTYTINASGSGSLGETAFSDSSFVITAVADTNDVAPILLGNGLGFAVVNSSLDISVAGIGNGNLFNANLSVSNQGNGIAGFGDNDKALAILFVDNTIFSGYDLRSSIGPIPGSPIFNTSESFPTTAGGFVLTEVSIATFSAVVIPEPTTLTLVCFCLSLSAVQRRKLPLPS